MDPFGVLGLLALASTLFFVPVVRHFSQQRTEAMKMWREAAQAAGFTGLQETSHRKWGDFTRSPRLVATRGPLKATFEHLVGNDKSETWVRIRGLPPALTLKLEGSGGTRDLELGDAEFDNEVYVQGSAPLVHAIMDSSFRLRVRSMLGTGLEVVGGVLYKRVPNDYRLGGLGSEYIITSSAAPLKSMLPLLVDFAHRLMRPSDLVDRLAANATRDPVPGVRRTNLLVLAREYPEHAATRPALVAALADPHDTVRLCAATLLAPEGTPVLLEIAGGENTDDASAGQAVIALGPRLAPERALAILIQALRARRLSTAAACIGRLGGSRSADAVPTLAKVLALEQGVLAEDAARALAACATPEGEAALVGGLQHRVTRVRVAAAEALGASGSVAAVEPLRRAEAHDSQASFRRAARQAIAAIQARAGSASPGQLTLAEGESGRLSLEDDEAGHVSLAVGSTGRP